MVEYALPSRHTLGKPQAALISGAFLSGVPDTTTFIAGSGGNLLKQTLQLEYQGLSLIGEYAAPCVGLEEKLLV